MQPLRVVPGDYVKMERNSERFWASVVSVTADGAAIDAVVDNDLVQNPELRCGDPISVKLADVLEVARPPDYIAFARRVQELCSGGDGTCEKAQEVAALE